MNNPISAGIDVGKDELVACIRRTDGTSTSPTSFLNNTLGLKALLVHLKNHKIHNSSPILVESTGPYHLQTARFFTTQGYNLKVVNPLHSKQIARLSVRKRKTDKVDATNLAFLASQSYGYQYRETAEQYQLKALVRHYFVLQHAITRLKKHDTYLSQFTQLTAPSGLKSLLTAQQKTQAQILSIVGTGNNLKYLDSIPGISPFLGAVILAELGDWTKFSSVKQVIAFAGLDPQVKQSGGKSPSYSHLSKRGSKILRLALFQAAMGSANSKVFEPYYQKLKNQDRAYAEVLCIMARKILTLSFTLLKKRRVFNSVIFRERMGLDET